MVSHTTTLYHKRSLSGYHIYMCKLCKCSVEQFILFYWFPSHMQILDRTTVDFATKSFYYFRFESTKYFWFCVKRKVLKSTTLQLNKYSFLVCKSTNVWYCMIPLGSFCFSLCEYTNRLQISFDLVEKQFYKSDLSITVLHYKIHFLEIRHSKIGSWVFGHSSWNKSQSQIGVEDATRVRD